MLVYSAQTDNFEKGFRYRNPSFWAGEVEKLKSGEDAIKIIGEYPNIKKAYEAADIKVTVETLKQEKSKDQELTPERTETIQAALDLLDNDNDEHWTDGGKPKLAAVKALMDDDSVTGAEIKAVVPDLKRVK